MRQRSTLVLLAVLRWASATLVGWACGLGAGCTVESLGGTGVQSVPVAILASAIGAVAFNGLMRIEGEP